MVTESLSGFKKDGSWNEVVEYGERITEILEDEDVESQNFDEWKDWRPKSKDNLGKEMAEKTAEKASIDCDESGGLTKTMKKAFENFEKTVYREVMGKAGPQYFDSDLISAHIEKAGLLRGRQMFILEVDIHDLKLKEAVRKALT